MSLISLGLDTVNRMFAGGGATPPDPEAVTTKGKGAVSRSTCDKPTATEQNTQSLYRTAAKATLIALGVAAAGYVAYRWYTWTPPLQDDPRAIGALTEKLNPLCEEAAMDWCKQNIGEEQCSKPGFLEVDPVGFVREETHHLTCNIHVAARPAKTNGHIHTLQAALPEGLLTDREFRGLTKADLSAGKITFLKTVEWPSRHDALRQKLTPVCQQAARDWCEENFGEEQCNEPDFLKVGGVGFSRIRSSRLRMTCNVDLALPREIRLPRPYTLQATLPKGLLTDWELNGLPRADLSDGELTFRSTVSRSKQA